MFFAASHKLFLPALVFASAFTLCAQDAQQASHDRIEQLMQTLARGRSVGQVAVAPDGKRLAWIEGAPGGTEIHLAPRTDLGKFVRITAATSPEQHCRESELTWSPDSASLAFFSDCANPADQTDLYLSHLDGNPAKRLTNLDGYVEAPAFSPDGQSVAFLYVAGATRAAGALAAMKSPSGIIGQDGVEIQRIAVAQIATGQPAAPAFLSPANLHVYDFDWAPDSTSVAYVAADPPGENNWWVARLYTKAVGSAPKVILDPPQVPGPLHGLQIAVPRWSPDGKTIAFIGGLMSDQGVTGGDVWTIASSGGQPQNLTLQRPTSAAWITWGGNDHLYVSEIAGGDSQLVRLSLDGPASKPIFTFPGSVGDGTFELGLSATADRSHFLFHAGSFEHPDEIYDAATSDSAALNQLSHFNAGLEPAWGKSASIHWTSDSFHVQGWLLFPKDYDPAKKYPLIVEVHGGPASAILPRWGGSWALSPAAFSALGYFVLQPNPRGSYGEGEAFTQANRKDFGYGDLRDILAGVDAVVAKYSIDPNRVGLTGWSYGGFMTMFAVTQTHRFRAAVAGAGISDWQSYYGENSIDQWMIPYFGASVYDDPAVYAKSSAISYIKQTTTPTLSVVGDRDGECPAPQSFEFWHALRDLHVPSELVVYPNEGHGFVNPAHSRDVLERAIDWFSRYMPPSS
jgi:dipeptidyl aminopeptidase/acylaminoacyl peptidase